MSIAVEVLEYAGNGTTITVKQGRVHVRRYHQELDFDVNDWPDLKKALESAVIQHALGSVAVTKISV